MYGVWIKWQITLAHGQLWFKVTVFILAPQMIIAVLQFFRDSWLHGCIAPLQNDSFVAMSSCQWPLALPMSMFTVHFRWWNLWNTTSILIGHGDRLSFFSAFFLLLFICKIYRWWHAASVSMSVMTSSIIIQLLFIILHPRWIFVANPDQIRPHQT